ncbi:MAG: CARDB domain-containing protein [Armatimonadota bacterium]|nr:CARDB domain-containing protein [Armatimonadota bacterium]
MAVKRGPDLVVQEIIIREEGTEEFHNVRVSVRVRNVGGANAGRSMTALIYSDNATAGATVFTEPTPGIRAGGHHEVEFLIEGIAGRFSGMLLAVADAPVGASPTGQVTEGAPSLTMAVLTTRTDSNNTFGVICSTEGRTPPIRYQNPAYK